MRVLGAGLAGGACLLGIIAAGLARAETRAPAAPPAAAPALYLDEVQVPADAGGLTWHREAGSATPEETVLQYVPDGQSTLDWSQIITIKTMLPGHDPHAVVQRSLGVMRAVCGRISVLTTPPTQMLGDAATAGVSLPVLQVTDLVVTCRDPDVAALRRRFGAETVSLHRYEVTWYRVMMGTQANYVVQRAWHGDAIDGSVLGSPAVLDEWKHWLARVTVARRLAPNAESGQAVAPAGVRVP